MGDTLFWTFVIIQGWDSSYNVIQELVLLNGQTAVMTVNTYIRVSLMRVLQIGVESEHLNNEGILYLSVIGDNLTNGRPDTGRVIYSMEDGTGFITGICEHLFKNKSRVYFHRLAFSAESSGKQELQGELFSN